VQGVKKMGCSLPVSHLYQSVNLFTVQVIISGFSSGMKNLFADVEITDEHLFLFFV
jgi:hypothetical protein